MREHLHRCTVCGTIAEWHYVLGRGNRQELIPTFRLTPGSKGYAAGQGVIGNDPHIVSPDMANPLDAGTLRPVAA